METLTYSSGRASGCDSPGLLNDVGQAILSPAFLSELQPLGCACAFFFKHFVASRLVVFHSVHLLPELGHLVLHSLAIAIDTAQRAMLRKTVPRVDGDHVSKRELRFGIHFLLGNEDSRNRNKRSLRFLPLDRGVFNRLAMRVFL